MLLTIVGTAVGDDQVHRPNIVLILADDLGYGDLGCYGQKVIATPRLDRMAAEGMKFTQFYAGSTVCAPSRSVLMTGKHMGHTRVRGNGAGERQTLADEDVTVAEMLKGAGYATGLVGKWGLGDEGEGAWVGRPTNQGFDYFYGYLNQHHAHNFYPAWLWRGERKVDLANVVPGVPGDGPFGQGWATKRVEYSHDLFAADALRWVRDHKDRPFFLYLALTIPHANNEGSRGTGNGAEVPDHGPYADRDWPDPDKGQAAMISRMDADVGKLLDLLGELGIDDRTLVLFSSDNGPHNESRHNLDRFNPSGPLRGIKRALYEGGIRVPMIARWPGRIAPGSVSEHIAYLGDLMATAADIAGVKPPTPNDSISFLATLLGETDKQAKHAYLYWEFYEQGGRRAVRQGDWKAIRNGWNGPIELYNLADDLGEARDVAADHAGVVERMAKLMDEAHTPNPAWPPPQQKQPKQR